MGKALLLIGVAGLSFAMVQPAHAQHGHGGHGHGGHGHGGHGYGGHGHWHGGYGHNHAHWGHYHSHGLGLGYQPWYGGAGYYSPGVSYPSYSYYPINDALAPASAPAALAANQTVIQIILPDPEATVTIDGARTSSLGRVRVFNPPALEPGYTYSYKIQATWSRNGEAVGDVRTVAVIPGRASLVDFTQPANEPLPAPATKQSMPR